MSSNLPLQLTSFIGREREIADVTRLLGTTRLLMLVGAGGCGKTRLALQVASGLSDEYPDGVWLVDLAPLADPALVPQTVASVFDVHGSGATPLTSTLQSFLHAKHLLLVLDNCEHLVQACAALCDTLLHACPDLKILATSREALNTAGETSFRVPSLALPGPQQSLQIDILSQSESVRLLVARASAARSDFQLTESNARLIVQICERLDGMPLAIELAAARANSLSIDEIAARLDDRFRLLNSGSRSALPRYQTLRASIDWSYDLLSDAERVLLQRLAVFAGGFTLQAAESVCVEEHKNDVLDVLSRLAQRSLVAVKLEDIPRYRLLETIRQYAREKLVESGNENAARDRHLDYFVGFSEAAAPKLHGPEQMQWLDRLDTEHDNLRAALDWSLGDGRIESGVRLAAALMWFWDMRGYWSEGLQRVQSLLIRPEAAPRTLMRANALLVAAAVSGPMGQPDEVKIARRYLEELIAIARELGAAGKPALASGLGSLGFSIFAHDPTAAEAMLEEGLTLARALANEWLVAYLLNERGWLFLGRKDHRAALNAFEESLTRFRSLGDKRMAAAVSFQISRVYFREGEFARARQELEQSLPFFRQAKDGFHIWSTFNVLGEIARAEGTYELAETYYREGLKLARELGSKFEISIATRNVGYVALHNSDPESARAHFAEGLTLARELDANAQVAFALLGFASIAAVEKQARQAVQLLAVVDVLVKAGDKRYVTPASEVEYERNLALAREQLDEAAFNAAWDEGTALTLGQAIELALAEPIRTQPVRSLPQTMKEKFGGLTAREREVAVLIAQGKSNPSIAEALVVSERTVTTHVSNILSKLGFTSRTQVASWATARRLPQAQTK